MKKRTKQNGSGNDNWATPDYILGDIRKEFGDFFDPCPLNHDKTKWDGLKISWKKINFINPPYNNKDKVAFIRKAYEESLKGKVCVMLLPVSTSTIIFHEVIYPNAEIRFVRKRINFLADGKQNDKYKSGQMDSMIVIFRPKTQKNEDKS